MKILKLGSTDRVTKLTEHVHSSTKDTALALTQVDKAAVVSVKFVKTPDVLFFLLLMLILFVVNHLLWLAVVAADHSARHASGLVGLIPSTHHTRTTSVVEIGTH